MKRTFEVFTLLMKNRRSNVGFICFWIRIIFDRTGNLQTDNQGNTMKKLTYFILTSVLFTSCITNQEIQYFQGGKFSKGEPLLFENQNSQYKLQPNDVLNVKVKSENIETTDYLNMEPSGMFNNPTPLSVYINGYSIDDEGYINLPSIGKLKVAGLTVMGARDLVQKAVDESFTNATAFVFLVSFKISILGEVKIPGYYFINNNQGTILDALAMAGDMNEFADRKQIHLIRQNPKGSEVVLLDMTDPKVLASPFFYLAPNDAVYVPPLELKNQRSNLANLGIFGTALTAVSTAITLILLIDNMKAN